MVSKIKIKIKRQDNLDDLPYWEQFEIDYRQALSVISLLCAIRENPVTVEGVKTTPVVFECECGASACGACLMTINGKARLACESYVEELGTSIILEPLGKFQIVRDLVVDRSKMFDALQAKEIFTVADGVLGEIKGQSCHEYADESAYIFASCIMCGACVSACPQINERSDFCGAFIFSLAYALKIHPAGRHNSKDRMDRLIESGGLASCAGARVCESICPQNIPISEAIARLNLVATGHSLKMLFWN